MKRELGACIVELRGRYAAALTEDGRFVRVRNRGYAVGETVLLASEQPRGARRSRAAAMASMAAGFLLLLLGGWKGYQTPVGVVSLDVNPSIEYTINAFDRVLSIRGVNGDGEAILDRMDESLLTNQPVGEALEQTIEALRESGYLEQSAENDVVLSASSYSPQHAARLSEALKERVARQPDLAVTAVSVTREEVEQAHALGASAGKVRIVEQLEQSAPAGENFNRADWLEKPVREILRQTQAQGGGASSKTQQPQSGGTPPTNALPEAPGATPNPRGPKSTVEPENSPKQNNGKRKKNNEKKTAPPQTGTGSTPQK